MIIQVDKKIKFNKITKTFNKIKSKDFSSIYKLNNNKGFYLYLDEIDWPSDPKCDESFKIKQLILHKNFLIPPPRNVYGFNDKEIILLYNTIGKLYGFDNVRIKKSIEDNTIITPNNINFI